MCVHMKTFVIVETNGCKTHVGWPWGCWMCRERNECDTITITNIGIMKLENIIEKTIRGNAHVIEHVVCKRWCFEQIMCPTQQQQRHINKQHTFDLHNKNMMVSIVMHWSLLIRTVRMFIQKFINWNWCAKLMLINQWCFLCKLNMCIHVATLPSNNMFMLKILQHM